MRKSIDRNSESFSCAQLSIAVGLQEKEIGRIEAKTIGWKWNARQKHMIHILGVRALHLADGRHIDPLTVKRFEDIFVEEMEVTLPTIQSDIKALEDAGMIEKPFLDGSKKTKQVRLTQNGFSRWQEYANERAALIYVMQEALDTRGGIPGDWRTRLGKWTLSLFGDRNVAAAVALICMSLFAGLDNARAEYAAPSGFAPYTLHADSSLLLQNTAGFPHAGIVETLPVRPVWNGGTVVAARVAGFSDSAVVTDTDLEGTERSGIVVVSTEGLYDQLLPKQDLSDRTKVSYSAPGAITISSPGRYWVGMAAKPDFTGNQYWQSSDSTLRDWAYGFQDSAVSPSIRLADTEGLYDQLLPKMTDTEVAVKN